MQVGEQFSIALDMKPRVHTALLVSIYSASSGDALTLQLVEGVLKFTITIGGEDERVAALSMRTSRVLCDGNWHSVKVRVASSVVSAAAVGISSVCECRRSRRRT